jgi:hypothetical protein
MDNSEQTPYNRHGLKVYCKRDHGNPIQYPKPDSKKNIIKSNSANRRNGKNNHNSRTKKQQFWKYDEREQDDLFEFHPECEFVYESTWCPKVYSLDSWVNYHPTPTLDAGWLNCRCERCKGCIYPNQLHICLKLTTCRCPKLSVWDSDDDESVEDSPRRQIVFPPCNCGSSKCPVCSPPYYSDEEDLEILNSCWGCYRSSCQDCNPERYDSSDEEY